MLVFPRGGPVVLFQGAGPKPVAFPCVCSLLFGRQFGVLVRPKSIGTGTLFIQPGALVELYCAWGGPWQNPGPRCCMNPP